MRKVFGAFCFVCLGLMLIVLVLWMRSRWMSEGWTVMGGGRSIGVLSDESALQLAVARDDRAAAFRYGVRAASGDLAGSFGYENRASFRVWVPHWAVLVLLAAAPIAWVKRFGWPTGRVGLVLAASLVLPSAFWVAASRSDKSHRLGSSQNMPEAVAVTVVAALLGW